MPRKPLIRSSFHPYHVTSRANNKEWFQIPMEQVWDICLNSLKLAHSKHKVEIISFVLMNNHYHLLLKTPDQNLDLFMYEFNKSISLELRKKSNNINRMFGGRYKWTLVRSHKYFANCYRYVYQNPLRAQVTKRCENYPYSTLFYKSKGQLFTVPLFDQFGFSNKFKLTWLNEYISEKEIRAIKNGLYRSELTTLKDPKTRTLIY